MRRAGPVSSKRVGGGALSTVDSSAAGSKTWFYGTGRRKESIARVFIRPGSGKFTVNGRTAEQYFPNHAWLPHATEPLKFTSLAAQVDVEAAAKTAAARGPTRAVPIGFSRALTRIHPD